jgi:hypothetical protein
MGERSVDHGENGVSLGHDRAIDYQLTVVVVDDAVALADDRIGRLEWIVVNDAVASATIALGDAIRIEGICMMVEDWPAGLIERMILPPCPLRGLY